MPVNIRICEFGGTDIKFRTHVKVTETPVESQIWSAFLFQTDIDVNANMVGQQWEDVMNALNKYTVLGYTLTRIPSGDNEELHCTSVG